MSVSSIATLLLFGILIIFVGWIGQQALREMKRGSSIHMEVSDLNQEAEKIARENDALKSRIAYFETSDFTEQEARKKLNYRKPEETVVVIQPKTEKIPETSPQEKIQTQKTTPLSLLPNYLKWWYTFFPVPHS